MNTLLALSAATGEQLWSSPTEPCWGTPAAAKVGEETLIITADGDFFRARDGHKVASGAPHVRFSEPLVDNGIVYFIESGGKAYPLPTGDGEKLKELWTTKPHKDRRFASPVIYDGLIYTINETGVFSAIDAKTGAIVYEHEFKFDSKFAPYASVALAGKCLYIADSNGTTVLLAPGREFKEVARNFLEPYRSTPVFQGARMYLRCMKNLYCLGK